MATQMHDHGRGPTLEHRIGQRIGKSEQFPGSAGGVVRVLQVTGADDRPWMITGSITAAYTDGGQAAEDLGTSFPEIIATMQFGVDGAMLTAHLHVSRGVQFTVPASAVTIDARRILDANPLKNGPCIVTAQLCYGSHPAGHQAPILESVTAFPLVPGPLPLAALLPIPPFARAFSLLSDDLTALAGPLPIAVEVLDSDPTPLVLARYPVGPVFDSRPLPQGGAQLRLISPVGAPARVMRALFELAL